MTRNIQRLIIMTIKKAVTNTFIIMLVDKRHLTSQMLICLRQTYSIGNK